MAGTSKKLTQADVRKLPDGNHNFGGGLYLRVRGSSRTWSVRIQVESKRTFRGLGNAFAITLRQARIECDRQKSAMRSGDLQTKAEKAREERRKNLPKTTFKSVWLKAVEARERVAGWKTEEQGEQWRQSIRDHALPHLANLDVAEITRRDVLEALLPIWETKSITAMAVRQRLEMVFDWCIREGLRVKENPARWKGGLAFDLPSKNYLLKQNHHEAPTFDELVNAAPALILTDGGRCALFGILTAGRVSEFLKAKWEEIDFDERVLTIPPERRKDKKPYPHRVPLSKQAIKLLEMMPRDSEFIFRGRRSKTLSLDTPRTALRFAVCRPVTMHGCRSTFRDWCSENGIDEIVAEKCLMHATGNAVVQAYQRSDLIERRRYVMQKWANAICVHCEELLAQSTPSS